MLRSVTPLLRPSLLALALSAPAAAQVVIGGPLSDSTTGPLVSGTVYHATTSISVAAGETLTVQPGVIVKFGFDRLFTINGTLDVQGAGVDSVIFTDLRDDSAGGDTNGDGGATVPAAGYWRGVHFNNSSDASQVSGLTTRYAGRFISPFELQGSDATFVDCRAEDSGLHGFNLNTTSLPVLTNCAATRCMNEAFVGARIEGVPNFSGLAASSNGFNRVHVTSATLPVSLDLSIDTGNMIADALHLSSSIVVPASSKLTIGAGSVLKFTFDRIVVVNGEIDVDGTAQDPVTFTDERDDTVGGDTNNDGAASSPVPGFWRGVELNAGTDNSEFDWSQIRYAGRFIAGLELVGTSPTIRDCAVVDSGDHGLDLNTSSRPTLANVTVERCSLEALQSAELQALAGFSGLQFVNNGFDRIVVTSATLAAGESISVLRSQLFDDTLYLTTSVTVPDTAELTLEPGLVCKMTFDRIWSINGTLNCIGTPSEPIILTDERDDTAGGDLNNDGNATVPAPSFWRGVQFSDTSDGSTVAFTQIRYAGRFIAGVEIFHAALTLNRCWVRDSGTDGIDFNNNAEACVVERCRIDRCAGVAINNVRFERLQDIERAFGEDNGFNTVRVASGTLTEDTTIEPNNQFNGSILCASSIVVPAGIELNLQPGVVLKMVFDRTFVVNGTLTVRGTLDKPAIITEERDDSVGGDTNGDGNLTTPLAGYWRGITFNSSSDTSIVVGLEVRYPGRFQPGIVCSSPMTALREVRVRNSSDSGFRISAHLVALEKIVASNNNRNGIELQGGSFDLRQVSCVGNGLYGIDALAAYTGEARDSILWNNSSGPEIGLGAGRVLYSNAGAALAGADGNIDSDPLFVDEVNGDLHLTMGSPCIDAGDPGSPLDPDSTRADMGAHFFNFCAPEIICTQTMSFPPCEPTVTLDGFASLSSPLEFNLILDDAPTNSFAIFFYGLGSPTTINGAYGEICVGGPYERTMPVASGGNPADGPCAGQFVFDFNAYLDTGADPAIVAGSNVIGHLWYRYGAAPGNARFSDGIQIPVCP